MRRSLPLGLALLLASALDAQQWCAPGAEWLFSFVSQQAIGVRHAWYVGDTIVGGLTAKRIDQDIHAFVPVFPFTDPFYSPAQSIITAEVDDVVMLWSTSTNTYDTLMWFGAVPGDHWQVPHLPAPAQFDVLDTGTSVIDGIPLRYLVVEEPIVMGVTDTLRERIGFDYYYIDPNETFTLDFTTTWLQCYHDDDIAEFTGSVATYPCDFTLAMSEVGADHHLAYPNPGADHFTVEFAGRNAILEVTDATGRRVFSQELRESRTVIDASALVPGSYFLRLKGSCGALHWVKE